MVSFRSVTFLVSCPDFCSGARAGPLQQAIAASAELICGSKLTRKKYLYRPTECEALTNLTFQNRIKHFPFYRLSANSSFG